MGVESEGIILLHGYLREGSAGSHTVNVEQTWAGQPWAGQMQPSVHSHTHLTCPSPPIPCASERIKYSFIHHLSLAGCSFAHQAGHVVRDEHLGTSGPPNQIWELQETLPFLVKQTAESTKLVKIFITWYKLPFFVLSFFFKPYLLYALICWQWLFVQHFLQRAPAGLNRFIYTTTETRSVQAHIWRRVKQEGIRINS